MEHDGDFAALFGIPGLSRGFGGDEANLQQIKSNEVTELWVPSFDFHPISSFNDIFRFVAIVPR
jgi:hypothetical protein